ncbi:MAG: hypothetical protein CR989_01295 [Flavobacteriales bacterium]|nr:MAG: hypothetical protein CR989_01295 [Flavobacteriales bacterium]
MIRIQIILVFVYTVLAGDIMFGQETADSWASKYLSFSGYLKYMNTSSFRNLDVILSDNLIHNRLNFKAYINKNVTFTTEMRNRMVWGNTLNLYPNYPELLDSNNDGIDLSFFPVKEKGFIMLLEIDRLNFDFSNEKWHVVIGRQRINWGKNLAWNPNDIFNTYNFFDFDYEERPGTDALRVQYYLSGNSSIETAINYKKNWDDNTLALKYNFHAGNYDFQILTAKYLRDFMMGLGWEGVIKNIGFKGELSYFSPKDKEFDNTFVGALSLDYYFKNGIAINLGSLYNSTGISQITNLDISEFSSVKVSPKRLMPNKWSFFAQASKAFTPAINASFSAIYAKELDAYFAMPQFSYNIAQNWDVDITGQLFYGKENDKITNLANSIFLRFRYSF